MVSALVALLAFPDYGYQGWSNSDVPLEDLLPSASAAGAWAREGSPQLFQGEELFIHIDGGAEIYKEYGFRRVLVQDYRDPKKHRLSVEIYEMSSPEAAYGIFTFKTDPGGMEVPLGDECRLADYYLNLRQGHFLVTITGLDQARQTKSGLLVLARAIESNIKDTAPRPGLISLLPEENLIPQSLKFFGGPLALFNSYPFFPTEMYAFEQGAKGDYTDGYALCLFRYADERTAAARFAEVQRSFDRNQNIKDLSAAGGVFEAEDKKDKMIFGTGVGRYIVLVLGDKKTAAREIFNRLTGRLKD